MEPVAKRWFVPVRGGLIGLFEDWSDRLRKSPSFVSICVFASGNLLVSALSALGGIIQARWISPEVMGEFRKYGILTGYFTVFLVVTNDGLARQYSYLIGKGERDESERVAGAAKSWYLFSSWLATAIFSFLIIRAGLRKEWVAVLGWATQVVLSWSVLYGAYLGILYRNAHDFKKLTVNAVVGSALSFILLVAVKFFGFWGLCVRQSVGTGVGLWLTIRNAPLKVKPVVDIARLKHLARIGIPMSLAGYLSTSLWSSTEAFVILKQCGEKALGLVAVALFIVGAAQTLTNSIHQVYVPRITQHFGKNDDFVASLRFTLKPTAINFLVSLVIVAATLLCISPLMQLLIPKYVEAVPSIRLLIWILPLQALQMPLILFKANLMYWHLFIPAVAGFLLFLGLAWLANDSLVGLIVASLSGRVLVLLASLLMVYMSNFRNSRRHTYVSGDRVR